MLPRRWLVHFAEWLLLGVGVGCLAVYGWETVEARRFQAEQRAVFERAAAAHTSPAAVTLGGLVGIVEVPRLHLTAAVIEGDDESALDKAAGHLPDTPFPWERGNAAIAAHRDGLFRPLKGVRIGDEVRFRTTRSDLGYRVTRTAIVLPDDVSVLKPAAGDTVTLITCYPSSYVGAAPKRFVVTAERLGTRTTAN